MNGSHSRGGLVDLNKLTSEQLKIVCNPPNRNICINACPGSGKTTTILYRIWYMWTQCGISLSKIALFTYNNFLAKDMISKLPNFNMTDDQLGWCGTLHAFCYRETRKMDNLNPWIGAFSEKGYPIKDDYASEDIQKFRMKCQDLQYIIFDEYQDADAEIAGVLEILSRNRYLMIVGDERQQIYGFRDANASYLVKLKSDFQKFTLSQSFRCNQQICSLLSRLYPDYPEIRSKREGCMYLYQSHGYTMNNPRITNEIIKIIIEATKQSKSIAILSPILKGEKAELFINDLYSNIRGRCRLPVNREFTILQIDDPVDTLESGVEQNVISTIHGVKGKEYDVVIMLNVVDGETFFDSNYPGDLCKFFVGVSRARYELHIFYHIFGFSRKLKWVEENRDLFIQGWTPPEKDKHQPDKPKGDRRSTYINYIRSMKAKTRDRLLDEYSDLELLAQEPSNLEEIYLNMGSPKWLYKLIEAAYRFRFLGEYYWSSPPQLTPPPKDQDDDSKRYHTEYPVFITHHEYTQLNASKERELPDSVLEKLRIRYGPSRIPGTDFDVYRYRVFGNGIEIGYIMESGAFQSDAVIGPHNVVSDLVCHEYYRNLSHARECRTALRGYSQLYPYKITKEIVSMISWLQKFEALMHLNMVEFERPELDPTLASEIANIVQNSTILKEYTPFIPGLSVNRPLPEFIRSLDPRVSSSQKYEGKFDLICRHGLLTLRAGLSEHQIEDIWLELIIYNHLFTDTEYLRTQQTILNPQNVYDPSSVLSQKFNEINEHEKRPYVSREIYYFDPITSSLWVRRKCEN